jgi:site-specific recombinase XerD
MTANPNRHSAVRSLRLAEWPTADRTVWEEICRPRQRLQGGGRASHLKTTTRADLEKRYGLFLDHLQRTGKLTDGAEPAGLVTSGNVQSYVAELQGRVSSVTVYGSIVKLHRVARFLAPHRDFRWLAEIEADLRHEMRPRSKYDRLVLPEVLVKLGMTLMTEAETAAGLTPVGRARHYRNGFMVALLACCPIRLKNYAALELGSTFMQIKGAWWIVLDASMTKEGRPDERRVPKFLTRFVDIYLKVHRPVLEAKSKPSRALWLTRSGIPMEQCSVAETITETTYSTIGVKVSPHLFRTAAASGAAIHAPNMPGLGTAVLHQVDPRVTEAHYNRAGSNSAAAAYAAVIDLYRR